MTGNATSQSYLAFFYATGYADVVPTDKPFSTILVWTYELTTSIDPLAEVAYMYALLVAGAD